MPRIVFPFLVSKAIALFVFNIVINDLKKINILWIIVGNEGFGVRRATLGMAGELRRLGCKVEFVSLYEGKFSSEVRSSGHLLDILAGSPPISVRQQTAFLSGVMSHMRTQWRLRKRMVEIIKLRSPDILHIRHNALLILAGLSSLTTGVFVYWHLPNTINKRLPFNLQALCYQLFCLLAKVRPLANSQHTAESLGRQLLPIRVLYLGVDPVYFSVASDYRPLHREDVGLKESIPVFAIIARVVPEKAQDVVIKSVIQLLKAGVRLQLVVIGGPVDSVYYRDLEALVHSENRTKEIKLVPTVSDPRSWFALADVVINSRRDPEPFGLTIIEAMLMGKPVLAYRAGGPGETVIDGITGWLIDEASIGFYKNGICRALSNQARWVEMGQAARLHALKHFTINASARRYLKLVSCDLVEKYEPKTEY